MEAVQIAREVAATRAWPWIEPVAAHRRRGPGLRRSRWEVITNAEARGSAVRVVIDADSGAVIQAAFLPR